MFHGLAVWPKIGFQVVINKENRRFFILHRLAHFVDPGKVVKIRKYKQIRFVYRGFDFRLLVVEYQHLISARHPIETLRKRGRENDGHLVPFLLPVQCHTQ